MNGALSPQEVADKLGVSKITVLRLLRSGRLAGKHIGHRTWRVTEEALHAFMAGEQPKTPNRPKKTKK